MSRSIKVGSITIRDCQPARKRPGRPRTAGTSRPIVGGFVIETTPDFGSMFYADGTFVPTEESAKRFLFLSQAMEISRGLRTNGVTTRVKAF